MRLQQVDIAKAAVTLIFAVFIFVPATVMAGDPEPSTPPGTGTMKSLDEIYDKLDLMHGELNGAGSTGCDTDAFIARTGQTTTYEIGDDGDLQKGVAWPDPRFTNNGDGTITDNLTGLVWLRNNWCLRSVNWSAALAAANNLDNGQCGLSDGSQVGDWRLPNIRELLSLVDYSQRQPALIAGWDGFFTRGTAAFWSSTDWANFPSTAWVLETAFGRTLPNDTSLTCLDINPTEGVTCWGDMAVWAVRDPYQQ